MQLHQAKSNRLAFIAAFFMLLTALTVSGLAQAGGGAPSEMQQKLAAVKQSVAANQQRLHQYQWVETQQITLKGEPKPSKQFLCSYGPDGQVQKVPVGEQQQQQPSGGRLKQRVVEKKKEEMQDYMQDVKSVIGMYVPPNPQKMQAAFQAHNVSLVPGGGLVQLVFKNYAQPGDQMTISFEPQAKKVQSLNVETYMGQAKDAVTLAVQFASLPDGTNYAQQTVLDAKAKQLQVTTTNAQYNKLGQ